MRNEEVESCERVSGDISGPADDMITSTSVTVTVTIHADNAEQDSDDEDGTDTEMTSDDDTSCSTPTLTTVTVNRQVWEAYIITKFHHIHLQCVGYESESTLYPDTDCDDIWDDNSTTDHDDSTTDHDDIETEDEKSRMDSVSPVKRQALMLLSNYQYLVVSGTVGSVTVQAMTNSHVIRQH